MAVKKRVNKVINQAKEQAKQSLKILETLEKETLAKAKEFVKIPIPSDPKKMTNDEILASLRKIGLAPKPRSTPSASASSASKLSSLSSIRAATTRFRSNQSPG